MRYYPEASCPAYQDPDESLAFLQGYRLGFEMRPVAEYPTLAFFKGYHNGAYDGSLCDVDERAREIVANRARMAGQVIFAREVIAGAWDHTNRRDICEVRRRLMEEGEKSNA